MKTIPLIHLSNKKAVLLEGNSVTEKEVHEIASEFKKWDERHVRNNSKKVSPF